MMNTIYYENDNLIKEKKSINKYDYTIYDYTRQQNLGYPNYYITSKFSKSGFELININYWNDLLNDGHNIINIIVTGVEDPILDKREELLQENLETLKEISELKYNWNDEGAKSINIEIIKKMEEILPKLKYQPCIFPLVNENIQFEYEQDNGKYLEFETLNINKIKVFAMDENENPSYCEIDFNYYDIEKEVKKFYES